MLSPLVGAWAYFFAGGGGVWYIFANCPRTHSQQEGSSAEMATTPRKTFQRKVTWAFQFTRNSLGTIRRARFGGLLFNFSTLLRISHNHSRPLNISNSSCLSLVTGNWETFQQRESLREYDSNWLLQWHYDTFMPLLVDFLLVRPEQLKPFWLSKFANVGVVISSVW